MFISSYLERVLEELDLIPFNLHFKYRTVMDDETYPSCYVYLIDLSLEKIDARIKDYSEVSGNKMFYVFFKELSKLIPVLSITDHRNDLVFIAGNVLLYTSHFENEIEDIYSKIKKLPPDNKKNF